MLKINKVKLEKKEPVYDLLNVEDNSNFVCNGAVVSNCTEITLHSDEEHTYTCQPKFASLIKQGVGLTTLEHVNPNDIIWSKGGWTKVTHKISSGIKTVYEYFTCSGIFVGTEDHRVLQNQQKIQVNHAVFIDQCISPPLNLTEKNISELKELYLNYGTIDDQFQVHFKTKDKGAYQIFYFLSSLGFSPRIYYIDGQTVSSYYDVVISLNKDILQIQQFIEGLETYSNKNHIFRYSHCDVGVIKDKISLGDHEVFHIEVDHPSHTYWTGGLDVSNCVLSSLNLSKYDEWKDTDTIFDSTVFLDCVASEFISLGNDIKGLEKAVRFTEKGRALGLGALGFHTYLQQKMIPFESLDAHFENINIFKQIREESERASAWMAKTLGEPEWCKGHERRNTHLLAIAPNMSSGVLIGGVSQGIEPIYKNVFVQGSAAGELNRINPTLLDVMKAKGVYTESNITQIINNNGSVQNVTWLNDDEKKVFKTAFEIDQKAIIRLAASRQKYIDQAQSINLFFSADESEEYVSEVHQMAFNDPMIKSLYYIRSEAGVQASKGECEACSG